MLKDDEIGVTINKMKSSKYALDPVPAKLFKSSFQCLSHETTRIISISPQLRAFPSAFKTALVKPLLKKPDLDIKDLANYWPISNLPFLSKFDQLNNCLNTNTIYILVHIKTIKAQKSYSTHQQIIQQTGQRHQHKGQHQLKENACIHTALRQSKEI